MTDLAVPPRVSFRDHAQKTTIRGVRMSHLSIEVGHFYMDELDAEISSIEERFRRVAPWIEAAKASVVAGAKSPRVSTCFLVDDYFVRDTNPSVVIDKLLKAAHKAGVSIDYLARESACARIGAVAIADLVMAKLAAEPEPGTNGSRKPAQLSGWLSNGRRSWGDPWQAMKGGPWQAPEEFGARNHSVFLDVELFNQAAGDIAPTEPAERTWSCSFLAAVWQLLRLGLLRYEGKPPAEPKFLPADTDWGRKWTSLPAVIRLNEEAAGFSAYRTMSILPQAYLPIEHAVRTIVDHVAVDEEVLRQTRERAAGERVPLPESIAERITHVFVEGPPRAAR